MKITYRSKVITFEIEQLSNILVCKCIHLDENLYNYLKEKEQINFLKEHKIIFTYGKYLEFLCNIMYIPAKCKNKTFIIHCDNKYTAKFYLKNLLLALHKLYKKYKGER